MTHPVPSAVFDSGIGIMALNAQQAAIAAEREAVADQYLDAMTGMGPSDLVLSLEGFKIAYGPGWSKRAEQAGFPSLSILRSRVLSVCNDGDGRWKGAFPLEPASPRPARGTWVVYQLFLGDELLYIGSTGSFAERINAHKRTKVFDSWRAAECESEQHCRDLEGALIDRYRPRLNRMIPTPRMALT
jgi:hypothetical protein